ncbi:MAG: hypothetical protein KF681_10985 [Bdellovibrionaceae bacterium]|nr:hypothetical protein [Pseudobdellovibrionaceae bacterium]MBX3040692.1 hypothetical protein [Pseudobdellovibrionaceae bacterium]
MKEQIQQKLEQIALNRSIPFCYGCSKEAPTGCCESCGSDDLMRFLPEVGCEYGTDWVIKHILETELEAINLEEVFEESIRQCYPAETTVGWMTFDTVALMKENDPVSWRCALGDYESAEESEGNIISFDNGSTYFNIQTLEDFIEQEEA